MTIEEIRYDFTEHTEQFHNFFIKTIKLIIISKLNCLESNSTSLSYFSELINRIEGCDIHKVKYGKPMVFTRFLGHEFNYHTVRVIMKITGRFLIDITIESIITDFVKFFDKITMETSNIKWNKNNTKSNLRLDDNTNNESNVVEKREDIEKGERKRQENKLSKNAVQSEIDMMIVLLEQFIESLYFLITLPSSSHNSLSGRYIELKDISVIRRILSIEILIDNNTIILDLNPKSKDRIAVPIDSDEKIGNTLREIIFQNISHL